MSAGRYRISTLVLSSVIDLPELAPATGAADWTFAMAIGRLVSPSPVWFQRWRVPGGRWTLSFARSRHGYLLRFHGLADFSINIAEHAIVCARRGEATLATVRHLLLDQVIPLVLSREGRLVLHAAAVATPEGATALMGRTGSGKSTLAAALAASGLPLLTDDCLSVEPCRRGFLARSFYPGARLWPDSDRAVGAAGSAGGRAGASRAVAHYTRKRRIAAARVPFLADSAPLARVLVLGGRAGSRAARELTVTRLKGREALLAVLACTFQLDIADPSATRRGFDLQSQLVATTPVYRVSYPWRLARLAETRDALRRRLEAGEW